MSIDRFSIQSTAKPETETSKVANRLILEIGPDRYTRFFDGSVRLGVVPEGAVLRVDSQFQSDLLQKRFASDVERAVREVCGEKAVVRWEVEQRPHASTDDASGDSAEPTPALRIAAMPRSATKPSEAGRARRHARSRYSLDTLVIGQSNRMAVNAALQLASQKQVAGISALFVHGPCGVGKTHLLQGVADRFRREHPGARVRYVTGESFANEFIAAVQSRSLDAFRKRYRGVDLLCIDDVHFVAGKKATESELLHTIDALDLDGARVMLASDEHPKRIERLSQRFVSRCVSGMVVQIEPPDLELRSMLASRIAMRRGLQLEPGAVDAIASLCHASAREVEGAVLSIEAYQNLLSAHTAGVPVSVATVRRVLGSGSMNTGKRPLRVGLILEVVCEMLGVQPSDVLGTGRHRLVVLARSVTALLARDLTTRSFPEIARDLHRKNHSTIVTASQRVQKLIDAGETRDAGPLGELKVSALHARLKDEIVRRANS